MANMGAKRIALISPCGWGNLGDAAILDSAIHNLRQRDATIEFVGLTLNPVDTRLRHNIESMSVCGYSKNNYGVAIERHLDEPVAGRGNDVTQNEGGRAPTGHEKVRSEGGLRGRLKQLKFLVTLVKSLRQVRRKLDPFLGEIGHIRSSWRLLDDIDMVIVAGGGQVDDLWGGPFGHPYVLFRWATIARLKRKPFLMLSVGVGQLESRLSKFLFQRTSSLSTYRSFRDEGSKDLVSFASPTRGDHVVADLAFAHPMAGERYPFAGRAVGVSPMSYKGPRSWPSSDSEYFDNYVQSLAELVRKLVASECEVTLFCSVRGDEYVLESVLSHLEAPIRHWVACPLIETVDDLARAVGRVSVVVASRLHGLLLSSLTGRPLVALSFDRKVSDLMETLEAGASCLPIADFSVDDVVSLVEKQLTNYPQVSEQTLAIVREKRLQVEEQFDRILD
jgi:polysaccharide pyruvyl transferase WcaK-like protein